MTINYDNRNRIKDTTDVFGHLVEYEYELTPTVNQKRLKFDGAMYAKYNYDDADRLANILNSSDNTTVSFGYDNADRLTSRSYPNGITTSYEYDGMSRLKRLKDESSTAVLFDRQYAYNTASQINDGQDVLVDDNSGTLTKYLNKPRFALRKFILFSKT